MKSQEKKKRIINSLTIMKEAQNKMNLLDFRLICGGKSMILLGFAHREVARNHEKSVKKVLLSLNRNLRFTMKKKQKSREIAIQESSL